MTGEANGTDDYLLRGLAVPEGLDELHALLARVREEHSDLSSTDVMLFETAVIEIANNVVKHGRPPGQVSWTLRLGVHPDRIEALLSDDGQAWRGATPSQVMPEALAESGRGLALAGAALDQLDYERRDGANHWQMVRRRS